MTEDFKPYRTFSNVDPQYAGITYKDLIRPITLTEESLTQLISESTSVSITGGGGSGDIKSDGSVAFAADESMGGHKLTNVTNPVSAQDADTLSARQADTATKVPNTRTLTGTTPILIAGDNAAHDLSADRVISLDVTQIGSSGAMGASYYGDGSDGDLTLSGNTSLTASQYVFNYNNVTLAGFTLTASNEFTLLMVKGTLSLGGGIVQSYRGAVAAGGVPTDPTKAGTGGAGGGFNSAIWVFANKVTGTGTISANGNAGTAGSTGATAAGVNSGNGSGGGAAANQYFFGHLFNIVVAAPGGLGTAATVAGAIFNAVDLISTKNPMAWLRIADNYLDVSSKWYNNFGGASGGGSGEGQASNGPAGGAGGGGGGFIHAGGTGGGGEARGGGTGWSGGGGGGGAAGGCALVIVGNAPSTLTISANGGNGGAGGAAGGNAGPQTGNAGGGGGGSGGLVIAVTQTGSGVTVSATAGTGGAAGGGTANAGGTSSAGITMNMTRS